MSTPPIGSRLGSGVCHAFRSCKGWKARSCVSEVPSHGLKQNACHKQLRQLSNTGRAWNRLTNHDRQHTHHRRSQPVCMSATTKRSISDTSQLYHSSTTSSVSADEVSHFSRLASSWWDPHGPSRLLHLMNPLRHDFIRSCLASSATIPSDNKYTYLDIGCGGGIFASSAARLPTTETVHAIDPTPECIAVAESYARRDPALQPPRLSYHNCAIESLPPSIEPVDIITLFEVLEHISSPSSFLSQCIPHLKPGGWIIGSTISRSALSYITTKLIAEAPVIGIVPRGTHDWNQYINPSELKEWFGTRAEGGLWGDFRTQGVVYLPALGWKMVNKSEDFGNYFFGIQRVSERDKY